MRRVTAKPPNMLMAVSTRAANASQAIKPSGRPAVPISGGAICHQRPNGDDAGDGVGHAHQRRVQGGGHVPHHHVANKAGQHKHREVPKKAAGAYAPMNQKATAAIANTMAQCLGRQGAERHGPWPHLSASTGAAAGLGAGAGAALRGGAGQVTSPSLDHGEAANGVVFHVDHGHAILGLAQLFPSGAAGWWHTAWTTAWPGARPDRCSQ